MGDGSGRAWEPLGSLPGPPQALLVTTSSTPPPPPTAAPPSTAPTTTPPSGTSDTGTRCRRCRKRDRRWCDAASSAGRGRREKEHLSPRASRAVRWRRAPLLPVWLSGDFGAPDGSSGRHLAAVSTEASRPPESWETASRGWLLLHGMFGSCRCWGWRPHSSAASPPSGRAHRAEQPAESTSQPAARYAGRRNVATVRAAATRDARATPRSG